MVLNLLIFMIPSLVISWNESLYQLLALQGYFVFIKEDYYRLISSMFLHNNEIHLLMNMLSLFMVGRMLEQNISKLSYLSIYFISGVSGSLLYIYFNPFSVAVGASGAIFGLFGALAGFIFVHRNRMRKKFIQFMRDFGIILVINFFIGLVFPSIAMSAHVGGLIIGLIGGVIVAYHSLFIWFYIFSSIAFFLGSIQYFIKLY